MITEPNINADPRPIQCAGCGETVDPYHQDVMPDMFGGLWCPPCWEDRCNGAEDDLDEPEEERDRCARCGAVARPGQGYPLSCDDDRPLCPSCWRREEGEY